MQSIVLNFSYGTGPYLHTTELALAFNDELERRGASRMRIVVPWVYGERQRCVMREEFEAHVRRHPGEILLDPVLGAELKRVYYGDGTYASALERWLSISPEVQERIARHLHAGRISVETLEGGSIHVDMEDIAVELNRSPRVRFGVSPSYMVTFGYIEQILEAAVTHECIAIPEALARRGASLARSVEAAQRMRAIAYPGTFSGGAEYCPQYSGELLTPPHSSQYERLQSLGRVPRSAARVVCTIAYEGPVAGNGVYVTVTGIPGLDRLYREVRELGIALYSNVPEEVPGSTHALPDRIFDADILFQFARAGWGSIWLSMLVGTPIVVPEFDADDDPEIFFNNQMIEQLGIGVVYRGQSIREILLACASAAERCRVLKQEIVRRWGTTDGNVVSARYFVDDFLSLCTCTS